MDWGSMVRSWSTVSSFKKCGLSVALDGSEDHEVNIEDIQNYDMSIPFDDESFRLIDDVESDNKKLDLMKKL